MVMVGRQKYGCREYHVRRNPACTNKGRIAIADIETHLFAELQQRVWTAQVIDRTLFKLEKQVRDAERGASTEVAMLEKRRGVIEKELQNLALAVAATAGSPTVMAEIVTRERELREIASKLASVGQDAFKDRVYGLKASMLTEDPARAKAKLAMHAGPIKVTPHTNGYTVEGEWNLLGAPVLERVLRG